MAQSVADGLTVPSTQINLVYLTEAMDTRFDNYSVLRPLQLGVTPLPPATQPPETEAPADQVPEELFQ